MNISKSSFCLIFVLLFIFTACNRQNDGKLPSGLVTNPNTASGKNSNGLPVIEFEKDVHDFGKVIQGEKISYSFKFKNTGNADLVIAQVSTSCGCTVPQYPQSVIKPGQEESIKVLFDSKGTKGMQNKTITVVTNCQPPNAVIRIKAMVIVP